MKAQERIIWDSGFGYEIGYFVGDGKMYGCYEVDLVTGICTGLTCLSMYQIIEYSKEKIKELSRKYGYEKDWSEIF